MTQCPKCRNGISPGKPCPYCAATEEAQRLEDERLLEALKRLHARGLLTLVTGSFITKPTRFLVGEGERVQIRKGAKS